MSTEEGAVSVRKPSRRIVEAPAPTGGRATRADTRSPLRPASRRASTGVAAPTSSDDGGKRPSDDPVVEGSPSSSGGRVVVPRRAPEPTKEEAVKRPSPLTRAQVEARIAGVAQLNFYEMIGVNSDASQDDIQKAYYALAKTWHPDRLPEEHKDLRSKVARVFAKLNEAYRTLSDAEQRAGYDRLVKSGGGTAQDRDLVARAVDSALLFQKAEVHFKRGQLREAEVLLREASEADPSQPEYRTLLAWVQAQRLGPPAGDTPVDKLAHYATQLAVFDDVLEKEPRYERALFYRAELLKRSDHLQRAIADYKAALKINPRNIDAAREVRLYEMRRQKGDKTDASQGGGSLFQRLFGRNDD